MRNILKRKTLKKEPKEEKKSGFWSRNKDEDETEEEESEDEEPERGEEIPLLEPEQGQEEDDFPLTARQKAEYSPSFVKKPSRKSTLRTYSSSLKWSFFRETLQWKLQPRLSKT